MAEKEQIEAIIKLLEHMRKQPGMYFGDHTPPVLNFLAGFYSTTSVFGADNESDTVIYDTILKKRGWEKTSLHPLRTYP